MSKYTQNSLEENKWEVGRDCRRMEHLDEIGLKAYHRLQPSGKKPKASRDLSSSSTRTGDVGGKTGRQEMANVFNTRARAAGSHGFSGFKAFQKYGLGAGLTPASISQKGDASTQNYWLRRLGLVQNSMGAALAERKDTSNSSSIAVIAEENVDPHALTSAAKLASREKRNRKRTSRALAARCLSPLLKGNVECRAAGEGGGTSPADASGLVSQDRRRHLMSQLTGEDLDALLMREVLFLQKKHASSRGPSTTQSHDGSFDWCGVSAAPSCSSASQAKEGERCGQSDNGGSIDSQSIASFASGSAVSASGSSWSVLSALQHTSLVGAATGARDAREHSQAVERYSEVLLMSDCESV